MQNAKTAHTLTHWRYHLNEWVADYLTLEGHLKPEKIAERDTWDMKKRSDCANEIADDMQEKGEIRRLYKDFRGTIDDAQNVKVRKIAY